MSQIKAVVRQDDFITQKVVVRQDYSPQVPSVGIQGLSAEQTNLESAKNVDATNLNDGSILVYKTSTQKWTSTTTLDAQDMEGGEF